jgi:hypothetical protein
MAAVLRLPRPPGPCDDTGPAFDFIPFYIV